MIDDKFSRFEEPYAFSYESEYFDYKETDEYQIYTTGKAKKKNKQKNKKKNKKNKKNKDGDKEEPENEIDLWIYDNLIREIEYKKNPPVFYDADTDIYAERQHKCNCNDYCSCCNCCVL